MTGIFIVFHDTYSMQIFYCTASAKRQKGRSRAGLEAHGSALRKNLKCCIVPSLTWRDWFCTMKFKNCSYSNISVA